MNGNSSYKGDHEGVEKARLGVPHPVGDVPVLRQGARREELNRMNDESTTKITPDAPKHDWSRFDAMSEAERHAAALRDLTPNS